jgi:hypothetical protein
MESSLGKQCQPITKSELHDSPSAQATSREVSHAEFQQVAAAGTARLAKMAEGGHSTEGLSKPSVAEHAYAATREPWGGATYNPRTGDPVEFHGKDKHALAVREQGESSITVHPDAGQEHMQAAIGAAQERWSDKLGRSQHYLGVFHDADKKQIEVDPVVVTRGKQAAQEISAATHATGGAYNFASGDGVYPPHVK